MSLLSALEIYISCGRPTNFQDMHLALPPTSAAYTIPINPKVGTKCIQLLHFTSYHHMAYTLSYHGGVELAGFS